MQLTTVLFLHNRHKKLREVEPPPKANSTVSSQDKYITRKETENVPFVFHISSPASFVPAYQFETRPVNSLRVISFAPPS